MSHRCPSHCHRCPDLGGAVMPGCMGTAALALHDRDKSYCTCIKHQKEETAEIDWEEKIVGLERRIARLETNFRKSTKANA